MRATCRRNDDRRARREWRAIWLTLFHAVAEAVVFLAVCGALTFLCLWHEWLVATLIVGMFDGVIVLGIITEYLWMRRRHYHSASDDKPFSGIFVR